MAESVYKILPRQAWESARADNADGAVVPWAPIDHADGFMHLSAGHQVRETANKHFRGQADLMLLQIDPDGIVPGVLRWETSRGGDLFPHVHGDVPLASVVAEASLPWTGDGFVFPTGMGL